MIRHAQGEVIIRCNEINVAGDFEGEGWATHFITDKTLTTD